MADATAVERQTSVDDIPAASAARAPPRVWKAKCPKCSQDFPKPPPNWDCPKCNVKAWQPDETADRCEICGATVAKFTRHHCRQCGLVTCTDCTRSTKVIPEWGSEKQRVCKSCAMPDEPVVMEGFLSKLGQKRAFFGEKFQPRFFQLRGLVLVYAKDRNSPPHGQIDLDGAKVMDIAIHQNSFCLIGPRLQRGYVLSAETLEQKRIWMDRIQRQLDNRAKECSAGASTGGSANDDEDDAATENILFGGSENSKSISIHDFEIITVLGLGSFGRVMKVRHIKTGNIYAMKVLDKSQIIANRMVTHTQTEKSVLAEIDHPFIVKLHYAFQTRKHLVLVLDFLCGGELFFHLQRNRRFTEARARFYAAEIGMALEYIHAKNVIYRDLKPENLVLDRNGHVTLTDFGLAKREVKQMTHTFCGTPEYMAPELIQKKGHTFAVDWWSLGVFLFEMVSGLPPFYTQNVAEMYDLILHRPLRFPSFFSEELKALLLRLLERDPAKRLQSGREFRAHPFFKEVDWERLFRKEIRPDFVPDLTGNDLKYFDKQFTRESTNIPQLDLPNDPSDESSKRFEGFDFGGKIAPPGSEGSGSSSPPPNTVAPLPTVEL